MFCGHFCLFSSSISRSARLLSSVSLFLMVVSFFGRAQLRKATNTHLPTRDRAHRKANKEKKYPFVSILVYHFRSLFSAYSDAKSNNIKVGPILGHVPTSQLFKHFPYRILLTLPEIKYLEKAQLNSSQSHLN